MARCAMLQRNNIAEAFMIDRRTVMTAALAAIAGMIEAGGPWPRPA